MPSNSLRLWRTARSRELDAVESAHTSITGTGVGSRNAALQLNYGYTLLLSAHFQGFCRDLHTEAAEYLANRLTPATFRGVFRDVLVLHRKLDTGNPNAGNLGSDFNRFGMAFWDAVHALNTKTTGRRQRLEELNLWRNAIAHNDFSRVRSHRLPLEQVRRWRSACDRLAGSFDRVLTSYLQRETGTSPW